MNSFPETTSRRGATAIEYCFNYYLDLEIRFNEHTLAQLHELDEHYCGHSKLIDDAQTSLSHPNIRSLLTTDLVGHKHNKHIPPHSGPKRTFCLKRSRTNPDIGIYIALEDQLIDECTHERKSKNVFIYPESEHKPRFRIQHRWWVSYTRSIHATCYGTPLSVEHHNWDLDVLQGLHVQTLLLHHSPVGMVLKSEISIML